MVQLLLVHIGLWAGEIGSLAEAHDPAAVPLHPARHQPLVCRVREGAVLREDLEAGIIRQQHGVLPDPDPLTVGRPFQLAEPRGADPASWPWSTASRRCRSPGSRRRTACPA